MKRFLWVLPFLVITFLGCAPTVGYRLDTEIAPSGKCIRKAVIRGVPHAKASQRAINLNDYLVLPDVAKYENYVLTPGQLILGGRFASPNDIPSDLAKRTSHTKKLATNHVSFRKLDLILVEVLDFEERFKDIVTRKEGEKALQTLLGMVLDELSAAIDARFAAAYDTSSLKIYMREEIGSLAQRLYAQLWELRRARRGGIHIRNEAKEWEAILRHEADRHGIPLVMDNKEDPQHKVLSDFARKKIAELLQPRKGDGKELSVLLKDKEERKKLLGALQESIVSRHGSVKAFTDKIEAILPEIFGAYMISRFSILPNNPHFDIQARLLLPGHIVQTNGVRDMDGRILWKLTDLELGISGYTLWARSLIVQKKRIEALGLVGFPGHITTIETLFRELSIGKGEKLHTDLIDLLKTSVEAKSIGPLEDALALPPEDAPFASEESRKAGQNILTLLSRFIPSPDEAVNQADEDRTGSLSAPGHEE